MARFDLDGKEIEPLTICLIGGGGFIGSHLCDKLMQGTSHKIIVIDSSDQYIKHFVPSYTWIDRLQFHKFNTNYNAHLETLIKKADVTINFGTFFDQKDNAMDPLYRISRNFVDAIPVINFCTENKKRLIHFSSYEVYGKPIGSLLPKDNPLRQEPDFYILKEDASPCVFGPVADHRWSYACAKQLTERLIYGAAAENGLEFTIVRPFNWAGPRGDFGPGEAVPRLLNFFSYQLVRGRPLGVIDGGKSQHTFVHIREAIDALLLIIENPSRANGHIFNVGHPENGVTRKQLVEMMKQVYSRSTLDPSTIDVSSDDFHGEGYDNSNKFIPDTTIINRQLGWSAKMLLPDLVENTLRYQRLMHLLGIQGLEETTPSSVELHLLSQLRQLNVGSGSPKSKERNSGEGNDKLPAETELDANSSHNE